MNDHYLGLIKKLKKKKKEKLLGEDQLGNFQFLSPENDIPKHSFSFKLPNLTFMPA